jgi:hypothetical protein
MRKQPLAGGRDAGADYFKPSHDEKSKGAGRKASGREEKVRGLGGGLD